MGILSWGKLIYTKSYIDFSVLGILDAEGWDEAPSCKDIIANIFLPGSAEELVMDLSTKKNEVPLDLRVEKDVSFCHLRSKTNKFLRYVCNISRIR